MTSGAASRYPNRPVRHVTGDLEQANAPGLEGHTVEHGQLADEIGRL